MQQLFIFPHAGGSDVSFTSFQKRLRPEIESHVIPYPGRGKRFREPFSPDMKSLVDDCLSQLLTLLNGKEFAFLGHSFGALVAYECMLRMQAGNMPLPAVAFLTGRGAPSRPTGDKPKHNLPEKELVAYLESIGGMPGELAENTEFLAFYLPIIRNDLRLNESYVPVPAPKLHIPFILMNGTGDSGINREQIDEWFYLSYMTIKQEEFEGNHFFLIHNHKVTDKLNSYYKSLAL